MATTAADVLSDTIHDREQAMKFANALPRGEPNRDKIALTVLSDKVRQLIETPPSSDREASLLQLRSVSRLP